MTNQQQKTAAEFAEELRDDVIAIELSTKNIGRRRSMSARHKDEVADHFGAKRRSVSGSKALFVPNQPEIRAISSVLSQLHAEWMLMTIQYRKGVRLLRKEHLQKWIDCFAKHQAMLDEALAVADEHYTEIIEASQEWLGEKLFDPADYPFTFVGSVEISWGVFNFEPSEELLQLAPETYQREQLRVRTQFEDALANYEAELKQQMLTLIQSLQQKLADAAEGKKVVYTEAATKNLREFFDRFETLGVRSDYELEGLIATAKETLGGTTMADLKKNAVQRAELADGFKAVAGKLEALITEAPSRSISIDDLD